MGLLNFLSNQGSKYTYTAEGSLPTPYPVNYVPKVNALATNASNLHYDNKLNIKGWSTKGYESPQFPLTIQNYNLYKDGINNPIPNPSSLDFDDLGDPKYKVIFNENNKYGYQTFI